MSASGDRPALPADRCTPAGVTSDGVRCYFGKKDSDGYDSEDLVMWVTVGLPQTSGDNYVRLGRLGFDEARPFYPDRLAGMPSAERTEAILAGAEARRAYVAEVLSRHTSAQMLAVSIGAEEGGGGGR